MIKVSKLASRIAEKCFTEEEKAILEYTCGEKRISIEAQVNYYYKTAYGNGTEEELYDAICICKGENSELYEKLRSFSTQIQRYINPNAHDKQYTRNENNVFGSSTMGLAADEGYTVSEGSSQSSSQDLSSSVSTDRSDGAGGESDEVCSLPKVGSSHTLGETEIPASETPTRDPLPTPLVTTTNPQEDIKFRTFEANQSKSEEKSGSKSKEGSQSEDQSSTKTASGNLNVSASHASRGTVGTSRVLGEQLYNIWTGEIPKLRNKYGLIFKGLFCYERYY